VGQPVAVSLRPSTQPGLLRFEANRSLTGMGHERYTSADEAIGPSPSATLARRLLETGQVDSVHIYGNIVTVDLRKGFSGDALQPLIEDLYIYYRPGFVPPPLELPAEEAPAAGAATATGEGEGGPVDAALARVPAALLERSRQAKERWLAKQAG
jgi:hypothetical protein